MEHDIDGEDHNGLRSGVELDVALFIDFFFFQAEDGIRDLIVTGVQTCALPILVGGLKRERQTFNRTAASLGATLLALACVGLIIPGVYYHLLPSEHRDEVEHIIKIGRASCRERV